MLRETLKGEIVCEFLDLVDYDSIETIGEILTNYFHAVIVDRLDGPSERIWKFKINELDFTLYNDPYGNSIKGKTKESEKELSNIVKYWHLYS